MNFPTPHQIDMQIAQMLEVDNLNWSEDRNASAILPQPESKWYTFGKIVFNIYLDHMGWAGTRDADRIMPSTLAEILFGEPWIMPLAWVQINGWKWDGEQFIKKLR